MAISMDNERFNSTERTEFFGGVLQVIEDFETETGTKIYYSGMPYIRENLSALVKKELKDAASANHLDYHYNPADLFQELETRHHLHDGSLQWA